MAGSKARSTASGEYSAQRREKRAVEQQFAVPGELIAKLFYELSGNAAEYSATISLLHVLGAAIPDNEASRVEPLFLIPNNRIVWKPKCFFEATTEELLL